jgi:hypothetical protein
MKTNLVMFALAFGVVLAAGNLSAADSTTKPDVRSTTGQTTVTPPPRVHPNYECKGLTCTCINPRDCATMGADHVCQEGTIVGGTCTAKKL